MLAGLFQTPREIQFDSVYCSSAFSGAGADFPRIASELPTFYNCEYAAPDDNPWTTVTKEALKELFECCATPGFALTLKNLKIFDDVLLDCLVPLKSRIGSLNIQTSMSPYVDMFLLYALDRDDLENYAEELEICDDLADGYSSPIRSLEIDIQSTKEHDSALRDAFGLVIRAGDSQFLTLNYMIEPKDFNSNLTKFIEHSYNPLRKNHVQLYEYRLIRFELGSLTRKCDEKHMEQLDHYVFQFQGQHSNVFVQFLNRRRVILQVGKATYEPVIGEEPLDETLDHNRDGYNCRRKARKVEPMTGECSKAISVEDSS